MFIFLFEVEPASTFPKPAYSLISSDRLVGAEGAVVSPLAVSQSYLGLETHLHHICWLCESHSHGSCGATRHESSNNPSTCAECVCQSTSSFGEKPSLCNTRILRL